MTVRAVHHAGLTVSNMESSLHFYRDIMGLTVVDDDILSGKEVSEFVGVPDARLRAVMLAPGGRGTPYVELIEYLQPQGRPVRSSPQASDVGSSHFCFLVDSMSGEIERLRAHGVRFTSAPLLADAGPFKGQWSAYCFDPDGFIVELWSHHN